MSLSASIARPKSREKAQSKCQIADGGAGFLRAQRNSRAKSVDIQLDLHKIFSRRDKGKKYSMLLARVSYISNSFGYPNEPRV